MIGQLTKRSLHNAASHRFPIASWLAPTLSVSLIGAVCLVGGVALPAAAAVPAGPYTVNNANREDVRQLFNLVHEASNNVPDGWTGSIATCNPGTVSADYLAATLSRINYFRTMAGEPDVTFTDANNAQAQASALIQSANNALNHNPPSTGPGSTCWTALGATASAHSNLASGNEGPSAIDSLMYDGGALGHRRNMLDPSISTMGSGSIPTTPGFFSSEAQLVLTTPLPTRPPVRTGFVAWPPQGFVPYQVVYPRWSFSLPGADFTAATVTMQHNGVALGTSITCVDPNVSGAANCGQFGEPAISWIPANTSDGATWPQPAADDPYTVTISNAKVNGVAQAPFSYTVTVIDPAVADAAHTLSQAPSGPTSPAVNSNPTYTVNAIPDATGYQWRTSAQTPGDLIDGAEAGLVNFTANVTPAYNPISTVEHSTGFSSFRLVGFGDAGSPATQTLTLNRTLLASATSALSFDGLYWSNLNQFARVEVSLDGGGTWAPAFQEQPPRSEQDTAFTTKTVPLGQFAGHQIQLRFSLTFAGGNWAIGCCGEPNGWYIDNIAISNVQNAATPVLSAVGATPSFVFANPAPGPVSLDVRPQFSNPSFGNAFGAWSPALVVTSLGSTGLTSLVSSANPASGGQPVTYTATVSPTDNGGTVSFTNNSVAIAGCQSLPLSAGQATCTQTYTMNAPTSIVATYSGDSNFAGSASPPLIEVINAPAFTSGTLTSSATSVNGGQPVTFTATVSPTDGGGTVLFTDNGATIAGCGAVPLTAAGQATCTLISPGPEHSLIDASYSGDANFLGTDLGALIQSVVAATSTSLVASANPSIPGQQVTYTATVNPVSGLGTVYFTDNGSTISGCNDIFVDANSQVTCPITFTSPGPHSVQAFYNGWGGLGAYAPSTSAVLSQAVGTLNATATTMTSSVNPAMTGQSVTYTATVTPGGQSGTVSFTDAGNPIAACQSLTLSGASQASCTQTYNAVGPHSIAAFYGGDAGNAGSSSPGLQQTVNVAVPAAVATTAITNLGNGAAQVVFNQTTAASRATASPASNVVGYNVYQGTSPGNESSTPLNASRLLATATGFTVKGLTIGSTYYFTVKAINAGGVGPASAEVSARSATIPSAPRTLVSKSGKEAAALTWTAPASSGGSPITGYNVYRGTIGGKESPTPVNATLLPATARSYSATGLLDGTKYYFTVRATNAVATSVPSNEASATPANVPGLPTRLLGYAGNSVVRIRWVAPESTGGSPITGYNVYKGTTSGGISSTPVNGTPLSPTTTTFTVSLLTNNVKYFINVRAINAVGKSKASKQTSATPTASPTPPSWPVAVKATPGTGNAKLTWTKPTSTGGSAITGYNVYKGTVTGGESMTPVNPSPLAASATSYSVSGLLSSTQYFFFVKAINSVGLGAQSNETAARPYAPPTSPGAPGNVKATPGNAAVTLTWVSPSWNGGSAITGYNIYKGTVSGGESPTPVNAAPLSATTKTFTVTGLNHGTLYFFTIRAINAVGMSAPTEVSARPS